MRGTVAACAACCCCAAAACVYVDGGVYPHHHAAVRTAQSSTRTAVSWAAAACDAAAACSVERRCKSASRASPSCSNTGATRALRTSSITSSTSARRVVERGACLDSCTRDVRVCCSSTVSCSFLTHCVGVCAKHVEQKRIKHIVFQKESTYLFRKLYAHTKWQRNPNGLLQLCHTLCLLCLFTHRAGSLHKRIQCGACLCNSSLLLLLSLACGFFLGSLACLFFFRSLARRCPFFLGSFTSSFSCSFLFSSLAYLGFLGLFAFCFRFGLCFLACCLCFRFFFLFACLLAL